MATKRTNGDPTERMIAVLERIEAELRGVKAEANETNQRLGRVEAEAKETNRRLGRVEARLEGLETQAKRTNKRLGALEKRLTGVEVPAMAALEERVQRLEAAVFKPAAE
jgi:predicted  nucleic acid-binding Zn-ribbon protein